MKILLSNDDGIQAEGIQALAKALAKRHEVVVCAPMHEQSGMAHALHVRVPMEFARYEALEQLCPVEAWMLDGTPTDCVKVYLEAVWEGPMPDMVISGINCGANLATDVLYSGTVGAAMEGWLHGISSVAVSLDRWSEISYEEAAEIFIAYVEKEMQERRKPFFYNINFPRKFCSKEPEFVFSALGKRDYINAFEKHVDADGRTFFTVGGEIIDLDKGEATDIYAVEQGYVSVTPLQTELTDFSVLDEVLKK